MALGFRDCCNPSNYFYLTGIPGSVSENEVYFIETVQGETFCATYVNVPTLNYQPAVYSLISMTQQVNDGSCIEYTFVVNGGLFCEFTYISCDGTTVSQFLNAGTYTVLAQPNTISNLGGFNCSWYVTNEVVVQTGCQNCISTNPCPSVDTIFLSQFGPGSIATGTDCYIKTIFPMVANCQSIPPTDNTMDNGVVSIYVVGGTPPYVFYSAGTTTVFSPTINNNLYTLIDGSQNGGVPEGTYSFQVTDSNADFVVQLDCVLDAPNPSLIATCNTVATSIFLESDGQVLEPTTTGGVPPYTYYYNGAQTTFPITGLTAGNYPITILDSGVGLEQYNLTITCTVDNGPQPNWPDSLCFSFTLNNPLCQNTFKLSFQKRNTGIISNDYFNARPIYDLITPQYVGVTAMIVYWELGTGWKTDTVTPSQPIVTINPCSLPSSDFSFQKVTPNTEFPSGSWYATGMFNTASVLVTDGVCPIEVIANFTSFPCANNLIDNGQLNMVAVGGDGGPYTFFYQILSINPSPFIPCTNTSSCVATIEGRTGAIGTFTVAVWAKDNSQSPGQTSLSTSFNLTFSYLQPNDLFNSVSTSSNVDGLLGGIGTQWAENKIAYEGDWGTPQTSSVISQSGARSVTVYTSYYLDFSEDTQTLTTPLPDNGIWASTPKLENQISLVAGTNNYTRVQDLFEFYQLMSEAWIYWPGGGSISQGWYPYEFKNAIYEAYIPTLNRVFETLSPTGTFQGVQLSNGFSATAGYVNSQTFMENGAVGFTTYSDPDFPTIDIIPQGPNNNNNLINTDIGFSYGTNPTTNGGIYTYGGLPKDGFYTNQIGTFNPPISDPPSSIGFMRLRGFIDSIAGCATNQNRFFTPNGFTSLAGVLSTLNGVASFIPGEQRGLQWFADFAFAGDLFLIKKGVKLAFRYKTKLTSKDVQYIPTTKNNTSILTPANPCNTTVPTNVANNDNTTVGGILNYYMKFVFKGVGVNSGSGPAVFTQAVKNNSTLINPNGFDEINSGCIVTSTDSLVMGSADYGSSNNFIRNLYLENGTSYPYSLAIQINVNKSYANINTIQSESSTSTTDVSPIRRLPRPNLSDYGITQTPSWVSTIPWNFGSWPIS